MNQARTLAPEQLDHWLWKGLDWLFPPQCGGCQATGQRWCPACQSHVERITGPICSICGDPIHQEGEVCPSCRTQPPEYQALRSYAAFSGPLRNAIHRLKYEFDLGLGEPLSKPLVELYNDLKWEIDLIIPVPLNPKRNRERGYNQSGVLAKWFAYAIEKPVVPSALRRTRDTRPQVGLSAIQRKKNVDGAFEANIAQVKGKKVLLIDDVTTTGSTINACAHALHQAEASTVFGLTLARAILQAGADDLPNHIF